MESTALDKDKVVLIAPYMYELEGGAEKIIRSIEGYLRQRHRPVRCITNADLMSGQLDYRFSSHECELPVELRRDLQAADIVFAFGFAALQLVVKEQVAADTVLVTFETVVELPPKTKTRCIRVLFALEAIHHGKPVISFDSIGIRELAEFDQMRSIQLVGNVEEMAVEIVRMNAVPTYYQETLSSVDAYRRRYNRLVNFDRLLQGAIEELYRERTHE